MKKLCLLILFLITMLLPGCAWSQRQDDVLPDTRNETAAVSLIPINPALKKHLAFVNPEWEEINRFLENYDYVMERFVDEFIPLMSEEELADIEWPEDIRPYMEYDWLEDGYIREYHTLDAQWSMQLVDLNMDGQREMLVSHRYYRGDNPVCVYTVKDGEVVYCGLVFGEQIIPSPVTWDIDYLPAYNIDIYRNEDGLFRYLSCTGNEHQGFGEYDIYESTFDGTEITCRAVYAAMCSYDAHGRREWQYLTEGTDWKEDDVSLGALNGLMAEYMEGYEKVTPVILESAYAVPGCVDILPEEKREIVRANILAGFACAVETAVYDSDAVAVLGEKYDGFVNRYPEEELPWDGVVVDNRITTVNVEGYSRDIVFHPYTDITPSTSSFNLASGDMNNTYILWLHLYTPRFCTSRGIRVGMTEEELQAAYKNLESEDKAEQGTEYCYINGNLHILFYVKEGKIYEIYLQRSDLIP